jgi:hypothetical protein
MSDKQSQYGGVSKSSQFGGIAGGPAIEEDPEDASGAYTAFLSGLTNDERNRVFWIAKRRFPDIEDPSIYYAFDKNGDLFYRDPVTSEYKKEFKDGPLGNDVDYVGNIGPAGQFLGEVVGGVIGLGTGFLSGGFPGAMVGGAWGTAKGGGAAYGARAGLSYLLGGPPIDVETAAKDLAVSSAFGAIPLGVPAKAAPKGLRVLLEKFPGSDGRTILADIVQNGGRTVDEKLAYMSSKYPDINISRAEAAGLVGNKGYKAEVWISKHARNQQMIDHYESRNQRVAYHAENFFDNILSGKYSPQGIKNKLTGKPALDAELDVVKAADDYIKAEKEKLAKQVKPMYEDAYNMDVKIDVSDILDELDQKLLDKNIKREYRTALERVRESLIDQNTGTLKDSTELLHRSLKEDFRPVIDGLTKDNQQFIKGQVAKVREQLSQRLKYENPLYEQVTRLYDDALGASQALDRSIIGQFANVAEKGGEAAMRLTKKLFSGNIKAAEIQELKAVLQATDEGATAWQNLKGTWLSTQWDDVIASQTNPLGEPNAFLRALGIKAPDKAFKARYPGDVSAFFDEAAQATGKKANMWKAILEPDELKSFIDLTNMMQMVGRIQTQAGSDTFGNLAMDAILSKEAKQILGSGAGFKQSGAKVGGFFETIANIPSRITGTGFGDLMTGVRGRQKDAYMDLLISHIVDPSKVVESQAMLEAVKPLVYLMSQTFARSGKEGLAKLFTDIDSRNQSLMDASEERAIETQQVEAPLDQQNLQSQIQDFEMPDIATPAFEPDLNPMQLASATILPEEKDREIAMRQLGGIGSLV